MALPYADARFDMSAMGDVLFFIPDPQKGAAEIARVTRPGGTIAFYTWDIVRGGAPTQALWEEMAVIGKEGPRPPNFDVSRFEALKALWAEIDIVDVETRELVVQRTFANFDVHGG